MIIDSYSNPINELVVGSILGDGCLYKPKGCKHYQLDLSQGINQEDYIRYKTAVIKNSGFGTGKIYYYTHTDKRTNKPYTTLSSSSGVNKYFCSWAEMCYKNPYDSIFREKRFSNEFFDYLGPLALAVWYMDDGSMYYTYDDSRKTGGFSVSLATNGFSSEINDILVEVLKDKYGVCARKQPANNSYYLSLCKKNDIIKFIDIVSPYIVPSMKYKVDFYLQKSRALERSAVRLSTGNKMNGDSITLDVSPTT